MYSLWFYIVYRKSMQMCVCVVNDSVSCCAIGEWKILKDDIANNPKYLKIESIIFKHISTYLIQNS